MHRRTLLGTLAAGCGSALAGCGGSAVTGEVVANETPLSLTHEYAVQGTPSGTRLVVDVTAENDGTDRITTEGRVPELACTFLDDDGEQLYRSGLKPRDPIGVGATSAFEFALSTSVSEAERYELTATWTED
ncbi:hypothetical protein [Haloarcula laminariae]|uniref:hypothetical protein n=1 Tax=Haloarcula laminariae TaxID=2961577 RepID=UPI0021C90139|nr:hypothetical protein [Halomicroarcula laminariae]